MIESKESRFERVTSARTDKITKMIRLLGNCSTTAVYCYSKQQYNHMFDTLQAELNQARERFEYPKKGRSQFTLVKRPEDDWVSRQISMELPDGTSLRASSGTDSAYPSINVELIGEDKSAELICFAEFNSEREVPGVYIGAYQSGEDDPTYYEQYRQKEII